MSLFKKVWNNTEKLDNARLSTQTEPSGIKQINNIPYINDGSKYHLLDLYYPENAVGKLPVIIDIHGGGWMYGDKELNKMFCLNLAKRGFAVFNISYRLVPEISVNEQLFDCTRALNWISKHICDYPVCDDGSIMIMGDSAGGQLCAYSAILSRSSRLCSIFDIPEFNINITAMTLISPVSYMNNGIMGVYTKKMWGKDYKTKKSCKYMNLSDILEFAALPPTILITSSGDDIGRKQTVKAAEDIGKYTKDIKLLNYDKADGKKLPHVFSVLEPESNAGNDAIDKFCAFFTAHTEIKA